MAKVELEAKDRHVLPATLSAKADPGSHRKHLSVPSAILLGCFGNTGPAEGLANVHAGSEAILVLYLDGALLIDLWNETEVPEPMRTHWAAIVEATLHAPIAADSERYRRDDDTRRKPLYVVKHADS